jgi:hypothetical protein
VLAWLCNGPAWIELGALESLLEDFVVDILSGDLGTTVILVFLSEAFSLFNNPHFNQLWTCEVFQGSCRILNLVHNFHWLEVLQELIASLSSL